MKGRVAVVTKYNADFEIPGVPGAGGRAGRGPGPDHPGRDLRVRPPHLAGRAAGRHRRARPRPDLRSRDVRPGGAPRGEREDRLDGPAAGRGRPRHLLLLLPLRPLPGVPGRHPGRPAPSSGAGRGTPTTRRTSSAPTRTTTTSAPATSCTRSRPRSPTTSPPRSTARSPRSSTGSTRCGCGRATPWCCRAPAASGSTRARWPRRWGRPGSSSSTRSPSGSSWRGGSARTTR